MELILPAMMNTLLVLLIYVLEKYTVCKKLPGKAKQVIIGVLFGAVAIFATNHGIPLKETVVTLRNAAPLCAGLIFGAPAGLIAGFMGGLYRLIWGVGDYTRIAAGVSTMLVGCLAALLRKLMFDDRKPSWGYGAGIAVVSEAAHMLMIFLLNRHDAANAFAYVRGGCVPMMAGNAISVGLALLLVSLISKEKKKTDDRQKGIAQTFQTWLMVCILVAYLVTSIFTFNLQSNMAWTETQKVINLALNDVRQDVNDASDRHLLQVARKIRSEYLKDDQWDSKKLTRLALKNDVIEINIVDKNGVIV
ncbi:MAG: LytS/YhcK type 5TM receptor domain-containing protein [Clostridia bacterium]|nr:LytS/YhcK type 5TM receptor domain-containing protein [Clostridia bacterium]